MFEAFAHKPRINRGRWVSASAALHAMFVIIAWRAFVAVQSQPPAVERPRVTFFASPPPPPPPAGGAKATPKKPKIKKPDVIPKTVQPSTIAQPPEEKPAEPDEPEAQEGGVAGGVEGGVVGGTVGGQLGGVISEFDGRMTAPRMISGPQIQYTDKAIENDVEGLMIVRCLLTEAGEVRDCQVRQSVRFMDSAVVAALQQRRYTPVTLEGRPVKVYYPFRIRLNLPR